MMIDKNNSEDDAALEESDNLSGSWKQLVNQYKPQKMNNDSEIRENSISNQKWSICEESFENWEEIYFVNNFQNCRHKFHRDCIQKYVKEDLQNKWVKKTIWPVKNCACGITVTQALKILDNIVDICRFECNAYLYNI